MEWGEPIRRNYATDELQYETIARAAPGLPDAHVSAAAAQRFAAHWLVGVIADVTHLGLHAVYRVAAAACIVVLAAVLVRLALAFELPEPAAVIALGLVLANPYTTRLLLIAPAMLSDELLVLGIALALLGLVEDRPWLAVAGCVVAVLGREMGLPVAVGAGVWLFVGHRRGAAALALMLPAVVFAGAKVVGEQFSQPDPSAGAFTVVSPLLRLPGTARALADHIGRVVLASPVSLALLGAALLALALRGSLRLGRTPLTAALLLAALTVLQAVAFNPDWVQHNESRLAALGIVPLAFATAAALGATGAITSRPAVAVLVAGVALASLHHRYTWSGLVATPAAFVALEAVVAALLALLVLRSGARGAPATRT
jgi:hypothetical protein